MQPSGVKVKGSLDVGKQVTFALAASLTAVAKEGQGEVIKDLQGTFTLRGQWFKPSNRFGIRVTPARKTQLWSEVKTAADWLALHETGGTKTPDGRHVAIPTSLVRRTKRQVIARAQRPRNLKRAFVVQGQSGPVLVQRKTKKAYPIVPLYGLERSAKVRKQSTVFEPTFLVVNRRFGEIFYRQLKRALETAK